MPAEVFEIIKNGILAERSQFWKDFAPAFFGANRPGNKVTQGNQDAYWLLAMQQSVKAGVDCVTAFAQTEFTEDLKKFDIPTLIIHGDDDQIVPIDATARKAAKIIPNAVLKVYEGGSHGIANVPGEKERFNQDLLAFLQS